MLIVINDIGDVYTVDNLSAEELFGMDDALWTVIDTEVCKQFMNGSWEQIPKLGEKQ